MNCAIIILNWNGGADTIRCLNSLIPELKGGDYVFITDNGSTDQSVMMLREHLRSLGISFLEARSSELENVFNADTNFYLVLNGANLGFGAGNNTVLKKLEKLSTAIPCAWLLNNDAVVRTGALDALKSIMVADPGVGVAGSLILNYPQETIQCTGVKHYRYLGVSKLINKNVALSNFNADSPVDFDYLNGASLMLRVRAVSEAGFFDERFFLYSEEQDLQLRMKQKGYRLAFAPRSVILHALSGATAKSRHLFYFYYNMSSVYLNRKHFSGPSVVSACFSLIAITLIRSFPSWKCFRWGIKGIWKGLNR